MRYVEISTDDDGVSHLVDRSWPLFDGDFTPPSPAGYRVSDTVRASGMLMMHHPAGYRDEWHCAPQPVLGTVLSGSVLIQTSDGARRLLSPGEQFLATDLTGDGHKMEEANGAAYDLALVLLHDSPDPPEHGDSP